MARSRRRLPVVWTEAAARDMAEIATFVAGESPSGALRLLDRLHERARLLEASPRRGRFVPEMAAQGLRTWRELVAPPHRIVYRIDDRAVHVLAVLDARRDLADVLLDRLVRS